MSIYGHIDCGRQAVIAQLCKLIGFSAPRKPREAALRLLQQYTVVPIHQIVNFINTDSIDPLFAMDNSVAFLTDSLRTQVLRAAHYR